MGYGLSGIGHSVQKIQFVDDSAEIQLVDDSRCNLSLLNVRSSPCQDPRPFLCLRGACDAASFRSLMSEAGDLQVSAAR